MKHKYGLGALLVVVLAAAIGGLVLFHGAGRTPPGQPPLQSLTQQNLADIRNAFNSDKRDVRVLLLLSPT